MAVRLGARCGGASWRRWRGEVAIAWRRRGELMVVGRQGELIAAWGKVAVERCDKNIEM